MKTKNEFSQRELLKTSGALIVRRLLALIYLLTKRGLMRRRA